MKEKKEEEPKVFSIDLTKAGCYHSFVRIGSSVVCVHCKIFYKDIEGNFPIDLTNAHYENLKKTFTPTHS